VTRVSRAHLRLMSTLPVRTVQAKIHEEPRKQGKHLSYKQRQRVNEQIEELMEKGVNIREIARLTGVSKRMVRYRAKRMAAK
jgi:hypothetical protein